MKQCIVVSGMGGQGVLFLTRLIAETGVRLDLEVLTAETHGMAQRGGTVISTVKVGPFRSPLIRRGGADLGLFLHPDNLDAHRPLLRAGAPCLVNTARPGDYRAVDAAGRARELGGLVLANLVLFGFAAGSDVLFCSREQAEQTVRELSRAGEAERNRVAFRSGVAAAGS